MSRKIGKNFKGQIRCEKQTEILTHATHVSGCSRLHELHESKSPFVSHIQFIRSKLSNFSAHVSGVSDVTTPVPLNASPVVDSIVLFEGNVFGDEAK